MSSWGVIWLKFSFNAEIIFMPPLKGCVLTSCGITPCEGYVLDEVAISMGPASCVLLSILC